MDNHIYTGILEEDVSYAYRQRYIDHPKGPTIPIGEMVISQKCLKGCRYCGIDARPNDALMSLDLFYQILESYQTTFCLPNRRMLFLGDAEVIIHPNLIEMLELLGGKHVTLPVKFITAGLLPKNQEIGRKNLEMLARICARAEIGLTIDIMHEIPMTEYAACIKETIGKLGFLGRQLGIRGISTEKNAMDTMGWIRKNIGLDLGSALPLAPVGRGALMARSEEEVSALFREECGLLGDFRKYLQPTFSIRPNGDVSVHCCGLGATRGPTLGNVYEHDAEGIHQQYELFLQEHMERCRTKPPNVHVCEYHRTWKKKFVPEKSRYPIVKACKTRACGV